MMVHCNTPTDVVLLLMMMISTNAAQLTIEATRGGTGIENNIIRLTCRDSDTLNVTRATFYRRDPQDGSERQIPIAQFPISIHTEGFYFCNNSMGRSNIQPINAFPSRRALTNSNPPSGVWGAPYTAECPLQFGRLSQYYSMTWTIHFSDGIDADIDTNTTDYQLIGSSLRIATFTPFVRSLECRLTTTGVPPFLGTSEDNATQTGFIFNIGVQRVLGAAITEPPQDYTAAVGSSGVFQCTALVPNIRTIEFEIFNGSITTDDNNCTRISSIIKTCSRVIDSHPVSLTCDYSIDNQMNCTLSVKNLSRSSEVICRVLDQSTVLAMEAAQLVVSGESPDLTIPSQQHIQVTRLPSNTVSVTPVSMVSVTPPPSSFSSTSVIYGGLAAITIIFITTSMFLTLLVAVLYRKYRRKELEEQIYEYTPPNSSNKYLLPPPPLPSPRITTTDNPAYERIPTMDCVAYASSSRLMNLDQQLTIQTLSSIVSVV